MDVSILQFLPVMKRGNLFCWPSVMIDSLRTFSEAVDSGDSLYNFITNARCKIGLAKERLCHYSREGYSLFFDDLISRDESRKLFEETFPALAKLLLRLPELLDKHYKEYGPRNMVEDDMSKGKFTVIDLSLRILSPQQPGMVFVSQELAAALLACALFCLFPSSQRWECHLQSINFDTLFAGLCTGLPSQEQKIRCLMNYFQRICCNTPEGAVSFERKVLPFNGNVFPLRYRSFASWSQSLNPLCRFEVLDTGRIEDHDREALEVDFANKYLGGGALGNGRVQEEIRFMLNPELIVGMLFLPGMDDNESIEIVGTERFSNYEGYASGFRFSGNFIDKKKRDVYERYESRIVAIDALSLPGENQFQVKKIRREANKAFCGFFDHAEIRGYFRYFNKSGTHDKHNCTRVSNMANDNFVRVSDMSKQPSPLMEDLEISNDQELKMNCMTSNFSNQGQQMEDFNATTDFKYENEEQATCSLPCVNCLGISTGNWGCGAFGGDIELKSMLQWIAASEASRPFILYFTFGDQISQRLEMITKWITSHKWTVGELWDILLQYSNQRLAGKAVDSFFDWVLPFVTKESEYQSKLACAEDQLRTKETMLEQEVARVTALESKIGELQAKIEETEQNYMNEVARASAAAAEMEETQSRLVVELEGKLQQVQTEYLALVEQKERFLAESETLAEKNLKLNEQLIFYQNQVDSLEKAYEQVQNESQSLSEMIAASQKRFEDLTEQLAQEKTSHQSQISFTEEANSRLEVECTKLKDDLKAKGENLEGQLLQASSRFQKAEAELKEKMHQAEEYKTELDNVKEKLGKSVIAEGDLQEKLHSSADELRKAEERETHLKNELQEATAKLAQLEELKKKLQKTENKLQEQVKASGGYSEKMTQAAQEIASLQSKLKKEMSKKTIPVESSRDIDTSLLVHADKKSVEKISEVEYAPVADTGVSQSFHAEQPPHTNFKFVFGIAVIAVLIGVILGKRY